ncbi:MAG: hypothetical protein SGCHY_001311 [Lobulomycetales sp.]
MQILCSLLMSSQTRDEVNAEAMGKLRAHFSDRGFTPAAIVKEDPVVLDNLYLLLLYNVNTRSIRQVGFHNKKTVYMQKTAALCLEKYAGDIPDTIEGMLELPGVGIFLHLFLTTQGPKMGYLALQIAWDKTLGIGVDIHVHRISNRMGWVKSKTPEQTRAQLEDWLPREYWRGVNPLLVGFGQKLCTPLRPGCQECPVKHLCPKIGARKPKRESLITLDHLHYCCKMWSAVAIVAIAVLLPPTLFLEDVPCVVQASRLLKRGCCSSKPVKRTQIVYYGSLKDLSLEHKVHNFATVHGLKLAGTFGRENCSSAVIESYIQRLDQGSVDLAHDFAAEFGLNQVDLAVVTHWIIHKKIPSPDRSGVSISSVLSKITPFDGIVTGYVNDRGCVALRNAWASNLAVKTVRLSEFSPGTPRSKSQLGAIAATKKMEDVGLESVPAGMLPQSSMGKSACMFKVKSKTGRWIGSMKGMPPFYPSVLFLESLTGGFQVIGAEDHDAQPFYMYYLEELDLEQVMPVSSFNIEMES